MVNAGEDLESIRDYRLVSRLGQGGMGTVYRAVHARLGKVVAVKVLPPGMMQPDAVLRFQREMRAVGKLHHPNIVQAFDAGEHQGTHFLAMECVEGCDLATLVKQQGPLSESDACEILRQAALGLQHAHQHGLVHRDIKPSNLMLSQDGQIKILDLGLALIQGPTDHGGDLTVACQIMGTPDFVAPEQASDSHSVDIRADIYSLGCTLYYLLTGTAPYLAPEFRTTMQKISAHLTRPFPDVCLLRSDVTAELKSVLERMVAKQPSDRFATPGEVAAAVASLAQGSDLIRIAAPATIAMVDGAATTLHPFGQQTLNDITRLPAKTATLSPQSGKNQPTASVAVGTARPRGKKWLLVAAAIVGLFVAAVATVRVPTKEGTLVLNVDGPDAVITIDGETAKVTLDASGKIYRVGVESGSHSLVVTTPDGLRYKTDQKFTIEAGNETRLSAHLERPAPTPATPVAPTEPLSVPKAGAKSSLVFDGDAWVELPTIPLDPANPITIEAWIEPEGDWSTSLITICDYVRLGIEGNGMRKGPKLTFNTEVTPKNTRGDRIFNIDDPVPAQRTHVAGVWNGRHGRLFVNGTVQGGDVCTPSHAPVQEFRIGKGKQFSNTKGFRGTIRELRVSSTSRYQKGFTPETRFERDDATVALYHCDDGQGDVLLDSSGNNRHGKIVGARWQEIGSSTPAIADKPKTPWTTREIAEWTIRQGGVVSLTANTSAKTIEELPTTFKIYKLRLDRLKSIGDEEAKLIGGWKQVQSLSLQLTSITDSGLRHLAPLQLSALDLYGTKITGEGFDAFAGRGVGTIVLTDCKLTEAGWKCLAAIGKTEQWFLDRTTLTDAAVQAISAKHQEIQVVFARSTAIDDTAVEALAKLPNLKSLDIGGTAVTDAGLSKLATASKLQKLQLSAAKFSSAAIEELRKALPNCEITVGSAASAAKSEKAAK